jgi:hypothetical protein
MICKILKKNPDIQPILLNWVITTLSEIDLKVRKTANSIVKAVAQTFGGNQSKETKMIFHIGQSLLIKV